MATRTYRYRIEPNREQRQELSMFFGCARKMYNLLLSWWQDEYKHCKETGEEMRNLPNYTYFSKMPEYSYFKECDSVAIQQSRMHLRTALDNFFKSKNGQRNGKLVGFPTFKKKDVSPDTYTTYNNAGAVCLDKEEKHLRLPKLGYVKIRLHRKFYGTIKSVNVSRNKAGRYYVCLTVENGEPEKPVISRKSRATNLSVVGLDMSMSQFVVSSNEEDNRITNYVRLYREYEKKLAKLQSKMSKKMMLPTERTFINKYGKEQVIKERSKNREKATLKYARLAEHVANKRTDYLVKLARYFVLKYDAIVLEDVDMHAMSRSLKLGKSVMDLGFGEFRQWLEWEASKYDCVIYYVDKWFASSQTCSECGYKNKDVKDLKVRDWVCPACGAHHDRDVNAAINLRNYFLERYNTVGATGIQACGDGASTLRVTVGRALPKDPGMGRKQETHDDSEVAGRTEARDFSRG